jgi:hypothetical protein
MLFNCGNCSLVLADLSCTYSCATSFVGYFLSWNVLGSGQNYFLYGYYCEFLFTLSGPG